MVMDPAKWYNTLLSCGMVKIGDIDAEDILDEMLVGDREYCLMSIREATYGSEVEIGQAYCSDCDEDFDAVVDLSDVPVKSLKSSKDRQFTVDLRKGGKATVRLPIGADQTAFLDDASLTNAERNTVLLSRVVLSVTVDGEDVPVAAYPSVVSSLGVLDRKKILKEIENRMPGPRYDEAVTIHDCGKAIPAPLGLMAMFPGL